MHTPILHPTDFTAFRKMLADMSIMELDEYEMIIHRDITKHMDEYSSKADVQEWSEKIKIIAAERKNRREDLFRSNAA